MDLASEELIPTRATLIARLKDWQDHSSWQEFSEIYWNLIYGVAIKGGLTPSEAKEVVQETLLTVAKNIHDFKYNPAHGSFKYWLLNITRWRITDQYRKRPPRARQPTAADTHDDWLTEIPQQNSEFDKIWDAEWEVNLLAAAQAKTKRQVNPQQYQIFDFCVHKEWPVERIAKMFAILPSQVYLAKHRVAEKIRQEVERLKKEIL
jgi:RNA polymerase sigma-70 factor (ECF subfamily)